MRRWLPWIVLAGHVALALGLFLALFSAPASDDYAGWSLAIAGLVLPAWFFLLRGRDPLGAVGALGLALPAGAGLGGVVASLVVLAGLSERAQVGGLVVVAPGMSLVATIILWLRLRRLPTRDAVRRAAVVVGAPALLALVLTGLTWREVLWAPRSGAELGFEAGLALALVLLDLLPLAWALALALAWWATADRGSRRS